MKKKKRRRYGYMITRARGRYKRYSIVNTDLFIKGIMVVLIIVSLIFLFTLKSKESSQQELVYDSKQEKIAALEITKEAINEIFKLAKENDKDVASLLALYIVQKEKGKQDSSIFKNIASYKLSMFESRKIKKMYKEAKQCYSQFITDVKIFPISAEYEYVYENSWNAERTYGGVRKHYGTDIMDPKNIRGNIPIVSISNGIVESIGWNNMGGYRVGVRTQNGGYIYYAHLDKYAPKLKKGSQLSVGDCIGYMGDSGYGEKGTVGEFPVHLHIGIATKALGSKEAWVNPYYILKYLEGKE